MQDMIKAGIVRMIGAGRNEVPARATPRRREFAAAQINRLTASWLAGAMASDGVIRNALPTLRARSRELSSSNEYAKNFFTKLKTHVVGPQGFTLQNKAKDRRGDLDQGDNRLVESAYQQWGKKGQCDVTGTFSMHDMEKMFIEAVARDGCALVRKVRGFGNRFKFALQFIDANRLPHDLNVDLENGNVIKMGIEFGEWDQPVAYYLRSKASAATFYHAGSNFQKIPAAEIIHGFMPWRSDAPTGVPWLHASMLGLHNLGGYIEAAIIAARVGAAKMGFFTGPGDSEEFDDGEENDTHAPLIDEVEPGQFDELPDGYDLKAWDPKYPHEQFNDFTRATLRGIAAGAGMSYSNLANDLDGLSYAGGRLGVMEERENWKMIQTWLSQSFHDQFFSDWLGMALLTRQIDLPFHVFDKLNAATWQPRRWQWFDPLKDIKAEIAAIEAGIKTRSQVIRDLGFDPYEVWDEMSKEQKHLKEKNITLGSPADMAAILSEAPSNDNTDEK